jgi:plastocyanin
VLTLRSQPLIVMLGLGLIFALVLRSATVIGQPAPTRATEVRVDNFTFSPEVVTVPVDSTITWTNKDDVPHVIASTNATFRSKGLDTDDHYSFTFTQRGTYSYYCSIHPKMTGKIIVQ